MLDLVFFALRIITVFFVSVIFVEFFLSRGAHYLKDVTNHYLAILTHLASMKKQGVEPDYGKAWRAPTNKTEQ